MLNFKTTMIGTAAVALGLMVPLAVAQDRDRDRDDRDRDRLSRIEPGTTITVRTNDGIDVNRSDERIYHGIVDQDVRGENGRVAIPRGSGVELKVRVAPDNDLILDLEAVNVNGQRYAVRADADRVDAPRDNSIVGAILGAVTGVQVRGRAVNVPRDSVLTFRVDRPMVVGVPYDRDRDDRR
jgi:hypothetical protein